MQRQVRALEAIALTLALLGLAAVAEARKLEPARVERPQFVVELKEEPGAGVVVALVARGGFHVNAEYPMNFTGPVRKVGRDGFTVDAQTARAAVPVEPRARRASGVLAFSVCDPEQCLIEKVALELVLAAPR